MKCESNYADIVKDNFTALGYESRNGDFDICIRCLLKLKDLRSFSNIFPKKRDEFQIYLCPEVQSYVNLDNTFHSVTDEASEIEDGHHHHEHRDEELDGVPDKFEERKFEIMRTNEQKREC